MKNHVLCLFLGLAGPVAHAQQPVAKPAKPITTAQAPAGYQELLLATINELQAAHTLPATRAAVGKLNRAAAAPTDWLPLYYQGLGYVQLSFLNNDEATRDKCLDQAQVLLDKSRIAEPEPGRSCWYSRATSTRPAWPCRLCCGRWSTAPRHRPSFRRPNASTPKIPAPAT